MFAVSALVDFLQKMFYNISYSSILTKLLILTLYYILHVLGETKLCLNSIQLSFLRFNQFY